MKGYVVLTKLPKGRPIGLRFDYEENRLEVFDGVERIAVAQPFLLPDHRERSPRTYDTLRTEGFALLKEAHEMWMAAWRERHK